MITTHTLDPTHWTAPAVPPLETDLHCPHCNRRGTLRLANHLTQATHTCPGPWTQGTP